jgi:hypothetical protein
MANIKNVTELDFDQIKVNLKAYLQGQDKFADYDFDGSGMAVLLDILAYNTQYNALLAHTNANEAFLDTAQMRANVVSHAKSLGYVPASSKSSEAKIDVTVIGAAGSNTFATIPRGTVFSGLIGSKQFTFITNESYITSKNILNRYVFENVSIFEGEIETFTYRVNGQIENQKFKIPTNKVDTSTLVVAVRDSATSETSEIYTHFNNILDVKSDSRVYFLQEGYGGEYEVYFGDGIIGSKPTTGQVVDIAYIKTNGAEANGASSFTTDATIGGFSGATAALSTGFIKTFSGADKEDIDSIKFNAPKAFQSQNRAVTSIDYNAILKLEYDFIEDISVWGGEVNDPPTYGKVFISIKPTTGDYLSTTTKSIINRFLSTKNVGSITTEIVNPDFTYITMEVFFKYDADNTAKSKAQLELAVKDAIINYNDVNLEKFDGVLRFSKLLKAIDNADKGILNSTVRLKMHKHVSPITGEIRDYPIKFSSPIYRTSSTEQTLSSSKFTYAGQECELSDIASDTYPNRIVQIRNASTKTILNSAAGTITPTTGMVNLTQIQIDSVATLLIFVDPDSNDIAPKFNQLVSIEKDQTPGIVITGEADSIAALGSVGASSYTTFSRHE